MCFLFNFVGQHHRMDEWLKGPTGKTTGDGRFFCSDDKGLGIDARGKRYTVQPLPECPKQDLPAFQVEVRGNQAA